MSPEHIAECRQEIRHIRAAADLWVVSDPELWRDLIDSCDLAAEALDKVEKKNAEQRTTPPL